MITTAQIDTLTSCCKHFLQKLTYARSAAVYIEEAQKGVPGLGYNLDLAQKIAARQEQDVVRLADEFSEELTKLLDQAAAEQRGVS